MSKASKVGLKELQMVKEDGSLLSRLEMEKQLREIETIHHRRNRANKLGLPNKIAQHMLAISVTHWILDHWVQNGTITGEVLGIRPEFDADDNKDYVRQLTQRLLLFVEHGLAMPPNPGEGIDMNFQQPPGFPPIPSPNGQQGAPVFAPPPPPPMPGMPGMAPPMIPQQGMPQQFSPPQFPQQMMPPMPQQGGFQPPMPPQPPQPPQQFAPPQQQMMAPQQHQQAPQGGGPAKADPTRQWGQAGKREDGTQRTRRTKEELGEDAQYENWCKSGGDPNVGAAQPQQHAQQQMPQMQQAPQQPPPMLAPPNPFGPSVMTPQPPQSMSQQFQQPPTQATQGFPMPTMGTGGTTAHLPNATAPTVPAATAEQVDQLMNQVKLMNQGLAQVLRVMYQKPGDSDLYLVLTEVCGIRPQ